MKKEIITLIICAIVVSITTWYLYDKLYGFEKIAWGLWGLAIYIGTIISERFKLNTNVRRKK